MALGLKFEFGNLAFTLVLGQGESACQGSKTPVTICVFIGKLWLKKKKKKKKKNLGQVLKLILIFVAKVSLNSGFLKWL